MSRDTDSRIKDVIEAKTVLDADEVGEKAIKEAVKYLKGRHSVAGTGTVAGRQHAIDMAATIIRSGFRE